MQRKTNHGIISIFFIGSVYCNVISVPGDAPTIQAGIDLAVNGDIVLVSAGTYIENISFDGEDIRVISISGAENTIIDGNQNGSVVSFVNYETENAELSGFTITNGNGNTGGSSPRFGGGIAIREFSNPTLRNLIIENNSAPVAESLGGGIAISLYSSPLLENIEIKNNYAYYGGGIAIYYSNPIIRNVIITGNDAYAGGGIMSQGSSPEIVRTVIQGNSTTNGGAGIWFYEDGEIVLNAVTITGNYDSYPEHYSGIMCIQNVNLTIINSILWNDGREIGTYTVSFAQNDIHVAYSDLQNGQEGIDVDLGEATWGEGNIQDDPLFVDSENGNYGLVEGSPCIDAGIDLYFAGGDTLLYCPPDEYNGSSMDMGAYESDYVVGVIQDPGIPAKFNLYQNYPNPFNPSTKIHYSIDKASVVTLKIYDLLGNTIKILVNEYQDSGVKTTIWDGKDNKNQKVSAGVYYYQLRAGDLNETRKLVLIK